MLIKVAVHLKSSVLLSLFEKFGCAKIVAELRFILHTVENE